MRLEKNDCRSKLCAWHFGFCIIFYRSDSIKLISISVENCDSKKEKKKLEAKKWSNFKPWFLWTERDTHRQREKKKNKKLILISYKRCKRRIMSALKRSALFFSSSLSEFAFVKTEVKRKEEKKNHCRKNMVSVHETICFFGWNTEFYTCFSLTYSPSHSAQVQGGKV